MASENQHWLPRFLIAKFADRDGRVYFLDVSTDRLGKRLPRQLASEYGFNDFTVDAGLFRSKASLRRSSSRAAPALARIVKRMSTAGLGDAD